MLRREERWRTGTTTTGLVLSWLKYKDIEPGWWEGVKVGKIEPVQGYEEKDSKEEPVTIQKYRKKPVVIEAVQWDGTTKSANEIVVWIRSYGGEVQWAHYPDMGNELTIVTLEGLMEVNPDDYVIKGVEDEFYPCKPDIFEQTYEAVVDVAQPENAMLGGPIPRPAREV